MRYNSLSINSGVLVLFTDSGNHHHWLISEHFPHSQKELPHSLAVTPHFPLSQSLATTNLLSVSVDLPILDISCERNHITSCKESFYDWLFSLTFLQFRHTVSYISTSLLSLLNNIPLSIRWYICSSVEHLDCSHFFGYCD